MFGGASYRICEARRVSHGVDPQLYMVPGHMFGNIPIVILLGDFMQLAPFQGRRRVSLLMPVTPSDLTEDMNGKTIFEKGELTWSF